MTHAAGTAGPLAGRRFLFAGESWVTHSIHVKGVSAYTSGTYGEGWQPLRQVIADAGAEVTYLPNHRAAEEFPRTPDELRPYDAVILSDIPSDTLLLERACYADGVRVPNRLQSIASYVSDGGGLLMIGGYMSFSGHGGHANYRHTPLARILPVDMLAGDDRAETPHGVVPTVVAPEHPIVAGLQAAHWPYFLGYNKVLMGADATLVLECEGDPFLAVRSVGSGRTAGFMSDCSEHWGSREFVSWAQYGRFWSQMLAWVAGAT
jgi:uncharacterized membrane protein